MENRKLRSFINRWDHTDLCGSMAYFMIRMIFCKILWNFDVVLEPGNENWIKDQRIYGTWQKLPLMVNLYPVKRG